MCRTTHSTIYIYKNIYIAKDFKRQENVEREMAFIKMAGDSSVQTLGKSVREIDNKVLYTTRKAFGFV